MEVQTQLAAFLYYHAKPQKSKAISFESLSAEDQAPFLGQAQAVLAGIEKLNLQLVPAVNAATREAVARDAHTRLVEILRGFLSTVKVWKKEAVLDSDVLPELAHRILQGGFHA